MNAVNTVLLTAVETPMIVTLQLFSPFSLSETSNDAPSPYFPSQKTFVVLILPLNISHFPDKYTVICGTNHFLYTKIHTLAG